jgi:geranylgeranyl diphosphate synthase type II
VTDGALVAVEETLRHYGELTRDATRVYLSQCEYPASLYQLATDYPGRVAKAIRPGLCLATCGAFGGELDEAMPTAVAIELFHNAFLIHDDIEDASVLRRGRPTLHALHGVPLALNAGDALAVMAQAPLRDNRRRLGTRMAALVADEFDLMLRRTLAGQAIELEWRRENAVALTPQDYLHLVMLKTCWYTTIHPLRVGALIGSWDRADLDGLIRFGFYLGAAFQIADDILNLTGDERRYGKELLGDLYEGKRTLMLIHLLGAAEGDPAREFLEHFLGLERPQRSAADVASVLDLMVRHGSIEFATEFGRGIARAAEELYDETFGRLAKSAEGHFIHDLIGWMLEREA